MIATLNTPRIVIEEASAEVLTHIKHIVCAAFIQSRCNVSSLKKLEDCTNTQLLVDSCIVFEQDQKDIKILDEVLQCVVWHYEYSEPQPDPRVWMFDRGVNHHVAY